jgi:hypothetical protein
LNPRETVSFRCRGGIVDNKSNWQKTLSAPFTISTAIHGVASVAAIWTIGFLVAI